MYGVRERMLLRHLLEVEGRSRSAAARELGINRSTLRRWIAAGLLDTEVEAIRARYGPRPPIPTKLDPVKPLLQTRLAEFPALSARRLFAECRGAGYTGGYSQLCAYVRSLRPAPAVEPVVRFETPPGHQAQVDFAHCRLPWGVRYALLVVLAFSRLLWIRFFPRQDLATLVHGLEACFQAWGGSPHELLCDQLRSVVTRDERLRGGGLIHNLEFLRFTRHYGVRPRVCRPYRAQTKGKVERPIRYLRESFLYGRTFCSDADLNAQVAHWLATVANPRVHATTGVSPLERFAAEQPHLRPLPARPYASPLLPALRPVPRVATGIPAVAVEQRSLATYAALVADASGGIG
jgi:transposase